MRVNVIFSKVSDQKRMEFNQIIPINQTKFEVLARLNASGDYYISIFLGNKGVTSLSQYTVIP